MDHAYVCKRVFVLLINFYSFVVLSKCIINLLVIKQSIALDFDFLRLLPKLGSCLIFHQGCNVSVSNNLAVVRVGEYFIEVFYCLIELTDPDICSRTLNEGSSQDFGVKFLILLEFFPFHPFDLHLNVITVCNTLFETSHFYESCSTIQSSCQEFSIKFYCF